LGYDDSESLIPSLRPLNLYGDSKQLFDLWVLENKLFKEFVGLKFLMFLDPMNTTKKR